MLRTDSLKTEYHLEFSLMSAAEKQKLFELRHKAGFLKGEKIHRISKKLEA